MEVSLTPDLEQLVTAKVASGRYPSASDMIGEGLRLLQERDESQEEQLDTLRKEIRLGLDQLDRGEAGDYDDVSLRELFERIKRRGRERLEPVSSIRRRARAAFYLVGHRFGPDEDDPFGFSDEVWSLAEDLTRHIEAADVAGALSLMDAVAAEWLKGFCSLPHLVEESVSLLDFLSRLVGMAIEDADVTVDEGGAWMWRLSNWQQCMMLVNLGRIQEVVDFGLAHCSSTAEALHLARSLARHGASREAERIARRGLALPGETNALRAWLRERKEGVSRDALEVEIDLSDRPDWALRVCRDRAEPLMDTGRSQQYGRAVAWLERARAIHMVAGCEGEWIAYLETLILRHRRKRSLKAMLERLR